jgi:triosephosphate isomerase (TIM)
MTNRALIYAANWKMNHGPAAAREYAERFLALTAPVEGRSLWFFPPSVSVGPLCQAMQRRRDITIGAQNAHWETKGAFTGEVAIPMLMEVGARAVLVGHSERRHLFGETDEQVAHKTQAAVKAGVRPLVCVGETLAERESGRTEKVVVQQLRAVLAVVEPSKWGMVAVAYEPVWAIGTGKNATPEDAAQVHALIRTELTHHKIREPVPVLYGGSVNSGNVLSLLARPELDGVLVGGASLDPEKWAELVGL